MPISLGHLFLDFFKEHPRSPMYRRLKQEAKRRQGLSEEDRIGLYARFALGGGFSAKEPSRLDRFQQQVLWSMHQGDPAKKDDHMKHLVHILGDDLEGQGLKSSQYLPPLTVSKYEPIGFANKQEVKSLLHAMRNVLQDSKFIPRDLIKKSIAISLGLITNSNFALSDTVQSELQACAMQILEKAGFDMANLAKDSLLPAIPDLPLITRHYMESWLKQYDYDYKWLRSSRDFVQKSPIFANQDSSYEFHGKAKSLVKDFGYNSAQNFFADIKNKTLVHLGSGQSKIAQAAVDAKIKTKIINVNPAFAFPDIHKQPIVQSKDETEVQNIAAYFDNLKGIKCRSVDKVFSAAAFPRYCYSWFQAQNTLREVMRILKRGGTFDILEVYEYPQELNNQGLPIEMYPYNLETFKRLAKAVSFEISEVREVSKQHIGDGKYVKAYAIRLRKPDVLNDHD